MGAGFGHLYNVDGDTFSAWGISPVNDSPDQFTEDFRDDWYSELRELAEDTLTVQYKGRTFEVPLEVESTYYGDDYCIVPEEYSLWENYRYAVEELSANPERIDWVNLAQKQTSKADLNTAFTLALLEHVQSRFPNAWVRKRFAGYSGSSYEPIDSVVGEIKETLAQEAKEKALRCLKNDKTRPQIDTDEEDSTTGSAPPPPPLPKRKCRF